MPDKRTLQQIAAHDQLQIAIENHVRAYRTEFTSADIEMAGDWILVASVTSLDLDNQERRFSYDLAFSGSEMPEHIAFGLLKAGERLLTEGMPS